MKIDPTVRSLTKNEGETKTSDKKKVSMERQEEKKTINQVNSEKKIENELDNLDLDQYPIYLGNLLNQSDWIRQNESVNILKIYFENKFRIILEKKKMNL